MNMVTDSEDRLETTVMFPISQSKHPAGATSHPHNKGLCGEIEFPPNMSIMAFGNRTPVMNLTVSHPRSGGVKGGMSVKFFADSSRKRFPGWEKRARSSRCWNCPTRYRICRGFHRES